LWLVLLLVACDREAPLDLSERVDEHALSADVPRRTDVITVGFDLRASPQEDARQYLPFLHYLSRATGLPFVLRFTPRGHDLGEDLGTGRVQLAMMGAVSFLRARERFGAVILARGRNKAGRAEYRSHFVVLPAAPLKGLQDLRGRRFAFGARDSTQGFLIPRIMLAEAGIGLDDLAGHVFTGSHQNCANAVLAGRADVCGMQDTLAEEMADAGLLRILATSRYYPSSGVAAAPELDPDRRQRIRQALLDFDPDADTERKFYHWERTEMARGFAPAEAADYRPLHDWLLRFGLLQGGA